MPQEGKIDKISCVNWEQRGGEGEERRTWLSCGRDREEEQGNSYLDSRSHFGFRKKAGVKKIPSNLQG